MRAASTPIRNIGTLTVGCLLACLSALPVQAGEPLHIFVSVLPQKYLVEQLGGDQVAAESMVQPGFSPETYEPNAQQVTRLAKADLFVRVGMPFEDAWMKRIQGVNPNMPILDAREGLTLREMPAHADEGGTPEAEHVAGHNELDAHIWTSPRMVKQMLAPLRDTLIRLRPELATQATTNYERLSAELDALDKELTQLFAQHPDNKFMVFHPAWGYLADAYHLTQIPIEFEGKEPGAKALTTLIEQAKAASVKTIFVQPQFDQRAAKQVAKAIDGKVVSIDPLAEDYITNLRKTARLIAGVDDE